MALRLLKSEILACTECPLREEAKAPVPGYGPVEGIKVIVIGERPGYQENIYGKPFIGESGQLLREAFKENKFDVDNSIYLSNAVRCYTLATPTKKKFAFCAERFLMRELKSKRLADVEFVLLLGSPALQVFFPSYKITEKRGQLLRHPDYPDKQFFATFHPAAVLRKASYESFFLADIEAFCHFVDHGVPAKHQTKYYYGTSHKKTRKILKHLSSKKVISFDIETSGLDPFANDFYISMISFSDAPGRAYVVPINHPEHSISRANLALLKTLLSDPRVKMIAHNCIFDIKCLKANLGIEVRGMTFDTMIAPYLHYEERKMPALKDLAAEFTDLGHYENELLAAVGETKKSAEVFQKAPFKILAKYSAKDSDATFRIYEIFKEELESEERTAKLMPRMLDVCDSIVDMESEGWFIDEKTLIKTKKKLEKILVDTVTAIHQIKAVERYIEDHEELNLRSSPQKAVLLSEYAKLPLTVRTPKGAFSTAKEILVSFADRSKLCQLLLEHSKLGKLISTYTTSLFEKKSDDGRLRTNYNIALTATGRLSSSKPNLQNIPSRGKYAPLIKKQFGSPPNFILCEGDFSQIELRIFAAYAKEKTMLHAYENDLDIHRITASAIYGIPEDEITKDQRTVGKTCNFALIYGISPDSLKERLLVDGDIRISLKGARKAHRAFFDKYPAATTYHRRIEKYVVKHGHIDTKFGHRKHLPAAQSLDPREQSHAFRVAYNHPIQGTAAGILFEALIRVREAFKGTDAKLLATVHDSILAYVPEDEVERYARLLKETMEDFEYSWLPIPIPADIQVGKTWGDLEEIEV